MELDKAGKFSRSVRNVLKYAMVLSAMEGMECWWEKGVPFSSVVRLPSLGVESKEWKEVRE